MTLPGITVTEHDTGLVNVEARADAPLFDDRPEPTYPQLVFDGLTKTGDGPFYAAATYWVNGERRRIPAAQFPTEGEARDYLTQMAELVLAANG